VDFLDQPKIPLERSILQPDTGPISAKYVAEHMRQPVYFDHAVQRLAKQYPEAIWLEAGSSSSITTMASKALGLPERSTFQPVNITNCSQPLQQLVNATMSLWKAGLRVSFWPHSRTQTHQYSPIIVPPYQFEKQRHWLEFKPPQKQIITEAVPSDKTAVDSVPTVPTTLYTLLSHLDDNEKKYRFAINTNVKQYVDVVSQHVISKTSQSCPVTFEIDMAIQAITSIRPALSQGSNLHPQIFNIVNEYPIFVDASRTIFLDFERLSTDTESWMFKFVSRSDGADESLHMKGQLYFQQFDEPRSNLDFSRFERLVTHERYLQAMQSDDDSEEVIQGQSIYKVFSDFVNYDKMFRGLQKVVGRSNESAGKVLRKRYATRTLFMLKSVSRCNHLICIQLLNVPDLYFKFEKLMLTEYLVPTTLG
jgi:acyl transferase domain-containing protein